MKEPSLLWYGALFEWHIPCCSALHCCCSPKFLSHPKDRALTWEVLGGVPCAVGIHQSLPCWSITKGDFAFIMWRRWGFIPPPHLCCQVLEWVLQIPWGDIRWKKQREKLWHRIMKCNVRDAFFAQHWCLEAVHTVLEGRALGEGEWMATVWRMNGNCSVSRQRADCCWARTSHLTKLSACCKQPILGTGSVNTVRIDWMGSHGKSRAHLDCFREGMESVLQTSW